jgi:hypothetical protein
MRAFAKSFASSGSWHLPDFASVIANASHPFLFKTGPQGPVYYLLAAKAAIYLLLRPASRPVFYLLLSGSSRAASKGALQAPLSKNPYNQCSNSQLHSVSPMRGHPECRLPELLLEETQLATSDLGGFLSRKFNTRHPDRGRSKYPARLSARGLSRPPSMPTVESLRRCQSSPDWLLAHPWIRDNLIALHGGDRWVA